MIKTFKFDYDYKNDSLFIYNPDSKSKSSIEMDDLIIDYNKNKELVAIEILNATTLFKNISNFKITKAKLKHLTNCNVEIIKKNQYFIIKLELTLNNDEKLLTPMILPTIIDKSPALT